MENQYKTIDKATWKRRELFEFYQGFEAPCFNVTVTLDARPIHARAKARGESFFLLCLYAILRAANAVPEMRQRILNGEPVEYEQIAVMTPIMTESEMFSPIWCEYVPTFAEFQAIAQPLVEAAKRNTPAPMPSGREDFICANCVPWFHFTSITQAEFSFTQTIPILAWGKMKDGMIPIACKFNHTFLDGLHVGRFFDDIEESFLNPERLG